MFSVTNFQSFIFTLAKDYKTSDAVRFAADRELLFERKDSAPDSLLGYGGIDFNNYPKTKAPVKRRQN